MTEDPINFRKAKDRRLLEQIEAEGAAQQEGWESYRATLLALMMTSGLTPGGLISATLRALLDVLIHRDGMKFDAAKRHINTHLKLFFDKG